MPAGTPPQKLLAAVRNFAKEKWGLKHRYAMVLHTDQPHPHVHVVLRAVSQQGERLNIRKAKLREWREDFAKALHSQGVAANATERAVRGVSQSSKIDGIYRAMRRGDSTHYEERALAAARSRAEHSPCLDSGRVKLHETRRSVARGWKVVADLLEQEGQGVLAAQARKFVLGMQPPHTEREWIAERLLVHHRNQSSAERRLTW